MTRPAQTWPAEAAARYRARGYWRGETFGAWLRARAHAHPERPAVIGGDERWSYAELDAMADRLAAGLLDRGFTAGERILIQLPNVPVFVPLVFGMFRAGVLPVFTLPAHRRTEIVHIARAAEATGYIACDRHGGFDYRALAADLEREVPTVRRTLVTGDAGAHEPLAALDTAEPRDLHEPAPDSVAFLQLSGGSTGLPKLIPRTHDDYIYTLRRSAEICRLDEHSIYMAALPVAHNFTMSSPGILGTLYAGGTVVLCPSPSPDEAFRLIAKEKVTITAVVPPLALIWTDAASSTPHDVSSLAVLQVGGAKLTPEAARRIEPALGTRLQQVFGMAEGLVNYTELDAPDEVRLLTQGRPMCPDDEVLVVDDDGQAVAEGEAGHLLTRGPYTIRAYHNDAAANLRAFTADGYYKTGDVVSRDARGYLTVLGRATDHINRGGEKISAEEIEDHLLAHPQVHDAAVVGIPDTYLGERTCAFVIPRGEQPSGPALKAWLRERGIAAFKVPDQVAFVDVFPATGVGKVSRRDLRAALRARAAARMAKD